jgi:hypothetical protein
LVWLIDFLCLMPLSAIFQLHLYIMATRFSGGRSRREPPTMGKQLVIFITCSCESSAPFFVIYKAGCELLFRFVNISLYFLTWLDFFYLSIFIHYTFVFFNLNHVYIFVSLHTFWTYCTGVLLYIWVSIIFEYHFS